MIKRNLGVSPGFRSLKTGSNMKSRAGWIAFAVKAGPKILATIVKLAKGLKFGKVGLAGASVVTYAYLFTWEFAALIMISLFVHESGHIYAMKRCGMKTRGIYFIPFLGGAAVTDSAFASRADEVYVALMGPLWGFALALLTAGVYSLTGNPVFAAAASWMGLVNLFNLLPINPLDGGRVMKSIAYSLSSCLGAIFLVVGIIAAGFIAVAAGLWLFVILLVVGAFELLGEFDKRAQIPSMGYADITASAFAYMAIIVLLWGLMNGMSHVPDAAAAMELLTD